MSQHEPSMNRGKFSTAVLNYCYHDVFGAQAEGLSDRKKLNFRRAARQIIPCTALAAISPAKS
jgi:hypothetical protein